jgi:branched-chain amino acid transport system substrate-binding protein
MRIIMRRTGLILLAFAAIGLIAGCGSSGSSSSSTSSASGSSGTTAAATASVGKPISVLWIGDTTGPTKALGSVQLAGLKAAAQYFNANGGVDGHHVTVTAVSDNGDGATGVTELVQHLDSSTPTLLVPGSEAGDSAAMIPVVAKHNVFAIDLNDGTLQCAKNASTACPNEFVEATPDQDVQIQAANFYKNKGYKKVGLLEESIDFTQSETPPFLSALKSDGVSVSTVQFPETAISLTSEMQELKSDGVQAVYVEALGPAAGYALTARATLGWTAPIGFDIAASSLDLTKLAPTSDDKNAFEVTYWSTPASVKNTAITEDTTLGQAYGDVDGTPLYVSGLGWDYLVNLADALKADGNNLSVSALDQGMLHMGSVDPLRLFTRSLGYSTSDHEDVLGSPNDYTVVPMGPIVKAQIQ